MKIWFRRRDVGLTVAFFIDEADKCLIDRRYTAFLGLQRFECRIFFMFLMCCVRERTLSAELNYGLSSSVVVLGGVGENALLLLR